MEVELSAEAKDKRINRLVALTVVILSVATGLGNIKDGNIVQAMDQAQIGRALLHGKGWQTNFARPLAAGQLQRRGRDVAGRIDLV